MRGWRKALQNEQETKKKQKIDMNYKTKEWKHKWKQARKYEQRDASLGSLTMKATVNNKPLCWTIDLLRSYYHWFYANFAGSIPLVTDLGYLSASFSLSISLTHTTTSFRVLQPTRLHN